MGVIEGIGRVMSGESNAQRAFGRDLKAARRAHKLGAEHVSRGQRLKGLADKVSRNRTPDWGIRGIEVIAGGHVATKTQDEILNGYDYPNPADPTGKTMRNVRGIVTHELPGMSDNADAEILRLKEGLDIREAQAKARGENFDRGLEEALIDRQRPKILEEIYKQWMRNQIGNRKRDAVAGRRLDVIQNQVHEHALDPNRVFNFKDPANPTPEELAAYNRAKADAEAFLKVAELELNEERLRELRKKYGKRWGGPLAALAAIVVESMKLGTSSAGLDRQHA